MVSATAVDQALKRLGNYRVLRAQVVALEGEPDGISGSLLLALGMRETWARNIEGGAKRAGDKWVPLDPKKPDEARRMDVGWIQISRLYHSITLDTMPAVRAGTWGPVVAGKYPTDAGYVPRFEEALQFALRSMKSNVDYAKDRGVKDPVRFSVAAHNAGRGGALSGYQQGNYDLFTALGDYSSWVIAARSEVTRWLNRHPNWRVDETSI